MISFSITIKLATTNYQGQSKRRCSLLSKVDANERAAVARATRTIITLKVDANEGAAVARDTMTT